MQSLSRYNKYICDILNYNKSFKRKVTTHTDVHKHKLQELFKKELTTKTSQFVQVARTASTNGRRGVTARDAIHEVTATILFGTRSADPSTWKSSSVNYTVCLSIILKVHHQWTVLSASPSSWKFIISEIYCLPLLHPDRVNQWNNYTVSLPFILERVNKWTILSAYPWSQRVSRWSIPSAPP